MKEINEHKSMTERKKNERRRTGQQKLLLRYFQFEIERKEHQKDDWSLEIREHEKEIERRRENQEDDWSFPNSGFLFRYINMKKKN